MTFPTAHPETFMFGTRLLMLTGRHKDGIEDQRTVLKVSHDADQFKRRYDELDTISRYGERIYASAVPRELKKAIRLFKIAQLESEWNEGDQFYRYLESRWISVLMKKDSADKQHSMWMFDCDNPKQTDLAHAFLKNSDIPIDYEYRTRNGMHILVRPFNRTLIQETELKGMVHDNPLILWKW